MQAYNTKELLDSLCSEIENIQLATRKLKELPADVLLAQPAEGKWSIVQVLEHLNSYNRYYLPQIESALAKADKTSMPLTTFRPGWLGDYFTKSMYSAVTTTGQVTNKMKAPKDHQPMADLNVVAVLDEFLAGTDRLRVLIMQSGNDLVGVKVPISIAKWVKIRLGDTYRFLVAHKVRHFLQIRNTLAAVQG